MKCYFYGSTTLTGDGIISFVIPDYGISFKTVWKDDVTECQYLGLLSLLRFIEINEDAFQGEKFEVYSDSIKVINQVKKIQPAESRYSSFIDSVRGFRKAFEFSLDWIPLLENKAFTGINNYPPNHKLSEHEFKLFDGIMD